VTVLVLKKNGFGVGEDDFGVKEEWFRCWRVAVTPLGQIIRTKLSPNRDVLGSDDH
jgi:hypothetical protein